MVSNISYRDSYRLDNIESLYNIWNDVAPYMFVYWWWDVNVILETKLGELPPTSYLVYLTTKLPVLGGCEANFYTFFTLWPKTFSPKAYSVQERALKQLINIFKALQPLVSLSEVDPFISITFGKCGRAAQLFDPLSLFKLAGG